MGLKKLNMSKAGLVDMYQIIIILVIGLGITIAGYFILNELNSTAGLSLLGMEISNIALIAGVIIIIIIMVIYDRSDKPKR